MLVNKSQSNISWLLRLNYDMFCVDSTADLIITDLPSTLWLSHCWALVRAEWLTAEETRLKARFHGDSSQIGADVSSGNDPLHSGQGISTSLGM